MKIRKHKGPLVTSLKTTVKIEPTKQAVIEWAYEDLWEWQVPKEYLDNITVKKYGEGIDERCGWDTHIVHLPGWGVLGFTDGSLQD